MKRKVIWHPPAALALWAALVSVLTWALLGLRLEGWQPLAHPFALAGAHGLPDARLFNALAFVVPGALLLVLADSLRRRLPDAANWRLRIGCTLALLAALGWTAQGLLPLDVTQMEATASRWHALAWAVWWIALAGAAALLAQAVPRLRVHGALLLAVLLLPWILPAGSALAVLAQPLAVLMWGGWMWTAGRLMRKIPAKCP